MLSNTNPEQGTDLREKFYHYIKFRNETPEKLRRNTKYYMKQFDLYQAGQRPKWNWAAFFMGGMWGMYRQMPFLLLLEMVIDLAMFLLPLVGFYFFSMAELQIYLQNQLNFEEKPYSISVFVSLLLGMVVYFIYRSVFAYKVNSYYVKKTLKRIQNKDLIRYPAVSYGIGVWFVWDLIGKGQHKIMEIILSLIPSSQ